MAGKAEKVPTAFDILLPGLLLSGLITVVVTIVIGIIVTHKIGGSIYHIQHNVNILKSGNFVSEINLRKKDEFQDLAIDVNQMAQEIKKRLKEIRLAILEVESSISKKEFVVTSSVTVKKQLDEIIRMLNYFRLQ
ncbi:MAG: hypothetical protein V1872_07900 [bacterium]